MDASRSAAVPGSAAAWPANAVTPPSRCRSANSSTLISESTRIVPQRKTVGPSTAIAPSTAIWPRPAVSPLGARSVATIDGGDQRADDADAARARSARGSGCGAATNASTSDADERDAEDDQQRRQQAVLDAGLGERRLRGSLGGLLLGTGLRGYGGRRVLHADLLQRVVDGGVDDRGQRLREEAEHARSGRAAGPARRPRGRRGPSCPAIAGTGGPVIVRWYISRM